MTPIGFVSVCVYSLWMTTSPVVHGLSLLMPSSSRRSRASQRFHGMLDKFRGFPPESIDAIESERFRLLLQSMNGAVKEPKIVRSFEILYEDFPPIRVSGDLIFGRVESAIARASDRVEAKRAAPLFRGNEDVALVEGLCRERDELEAARRVFRAIDADGNGTIDCDELLASGLLKQYGQSTQTFMELADLNGDGVLSYAEFIVGIASIMDAMEGDGDGEGEREREPLLGGGTSNTDGLVNLVLSRNGALTEEESRKEMSRHGIKFNDMVQEFKSWENDRSVIDRAKRRDYRMYEVLDGCFTGVRNPAIVQAFKILYEDYRPLRMGGDLIFKLMRKIMGK